MADFRSIDQFLDRKFDRDVLSTRLRVSRGGEGGGSLEPWRPEFFPWNPELEPFSTWIPGKNDDSC